MTDLELVIACSKVNDYAELEKLTGLKKTTLTQRRSQLRAIGWPIPAFAKGRVEGSGKPKAAPSLEDMRKLAEATGKTIEVIQAESVAVVAEVAKHAEAVKAGKAAKLVIVEVGIVATEATEQTTEVNTTETPANVG